MTQIIECPAVPRRTDENPEFAAIKTRQQAMWASGDFALIGTTLQGVGEQLAESVDLRAGSTVLDVACGNGNATLAAARRWCKVTGVDYVPSLLERAAERARAERFDVRLVQGDAENLPFSAGGFDYALSTFGVMFAPDHRLAARELARVCKPGGTIGLASWTPDGFIGRLLRVVAGYVPPPAGVPSPALWGTRDHLATLFADRLWSLSVTRRDFVFRYASAEHFVDVFRRFYGPTFKAFGALQSAEQAALAADIAKLLGDFNRAPGESMIVPAEYLEAVIVTR